MTGSLADVFCAPCAARWAFCVFFFPFFFRGCPVLQKRDRGFSLSLSLGSLTSDIQYLSKSSTTNTASMSTAVAVVIPPVPLCVLPSSSARARTECDRCLPCWFCLVIDQEREKEKRKKKLGAREEKKKKSWTHDLLFSAPAVTVRPRPRTSYHSKSCALLRTSI